MIEGLDLCPATALRNATVKVDGLCREYGREILLQAVARHLRQEVAEGIGRLDARTLDQMDIAERLVNLANFKAY